MMTDYFNKTNDIEFLKESIGTMAKELEFWEERRSAVVSKNGLERDMNISYFPLKKPNYF